MASARRVWGKRASAAADDALPPPPPPPPKDAFAALMQAAAVAPTGGPALNNNTGNSNSNGKAAKKATTGRSWFGRGGGGGGGGRLQPFKRIEGTRYVVDGFTCGASSGDVHFLTHFHSDHYIGLSKKWPSSVHASAVTAALVTRRLGLPSSQLVILPMDVAFEVAGGARVTCIDANHCPGAVIILFQLPDGRSILHTGDFRYDANAMTRHPALSPYVRVDQRLEQLDALYLDTTYLDPKYTFPTQEAVVRSVVETCRLLQQSPRTLVLFGSYSIGKERVFLQVGRELRVEIHVERAKWRLLECMQLDPCDRAMLTSEPNASTRYRVVPMGHLKAPRLRQMISESRGRFDAVVAFRPTGWAFGRGGGGGAGGGAAGRTIRLGGNVSIVEVPYSEHSSFEELRRCVHHFKPRKIVATVSGGPRGDKHAGMPLLLT